MQALPTHVDTRSEIYRTNREGFLEQIAYLNEQLALARADGDEKYVERHAQRGNLMAREQSSYPSPSRYWRVASAMDKEVSDRAAGSSPYKR